MPLASRPSNVGAANIYENAHRRVIPSEPKACQSVLCEIRQILEALEYEEHDVFSVHTAMDEALANAMKHGNGCRSDRQIEVECLANSRGIRIRITDEGTGFNPVDVPDPRLPKHLHRTHGRGLLMMRHFMNEVHFFNGGRTVEMWKQNGDGEFGSSEE